MNGRSVRLTDREPVGSQVLAETGFEPFDKHVLIQRVKFGSRLISLDERVDLRGAGVERSAARGIGPRLSYLQRAHVPV
ncbi:MAG: multiubiquitin domain-containing protein [Acidobacteriota bacterium]